MTITENKRDELVKDAIQSASVTMAEAKIELALLKYKVAVNKESPALAKERKRVRL